MMNYNPLAYLKERTIRRMRQPGNFDMNYYKPDVGRPHNICGTAACIAYNIVAAAGLDLELIEQYEVKYKARQLWSEAYGVKEACRLDFSGGWGCLTEVTVEEAVAHLEGAGPVFHERRYPEEETAA